MKNYSIIIMLLLTCKMYGQSFPDSNAIWNVNYSRFNETLYGLMGDTLIKDTIYNKLYVLSDTTLIEENLQEYIGGFIQDNQKVWFKPAYSDYTILLYDFGAKAGDTVWHNGGTLDGYSFVRDQNAKSIIHHISFEPKTLSLLSLDGLYIEEWYEGIGANFGLFAPIITHYPLSGSPKNLACFKHNDTVKYQRNSVCDRCFCGWSTDINEFTIDSDLIHVYQNPSTRTITIKVDKPYSNIDVQISDENGRVIYKKETLEDQIKIDEYAPGMYVVTVFVDNDTITKTIIIK